MQNCALLNTILGELMQMNFDNSSSIAENALTNEIHAGRQWPHIQEHFPYIYTLCSAGKHLQWPLKWHLRPHLRWSTCHIDSVSHISRHPYTPTLRLKDNYEPTRGRKKYPIRVHENKVQHISASAWIEISNDISGGLFVQPCQVSSSS